MGIKPIELREEFKEVEALNLCPRTLAEACVIYGDLADLNGRRIKTLLRLNDSISRYDGNLESSQDVTGNSLIIAKPRLLALAERVEQYFKGVKYLEKMQENIFYISSNNLKINIVNYFFILYFISLTVI